MSSITSASAQSVNLYRSRALPEPGEAEESPWELRGRAGAVREARQAEIRHQAAALIDP